MRSISKITFTLAIGFVAVAWAQLDGNPHNWDRRRRCDLFDYDPPCGVCEGYGGIATGDENDEITLTTCEVVSKAEDMNLTDIKPVQWGEQWHLDNAYEILIGKKTDPFCFQTFPGNDSIGELCYRGQTGSKDYDMTNTRAFIEELEVETPVGNITSKITHQGENFWIVNQFPWWSFGIHQCICINIREGGIGDANIYPISPNWINNLQYIGREIIGVEYIQETLELDHWAYGPHHLWAYPENGQILRMWQPFNGLQVYPKGVNNGTIDKDLFTDIPPAMCKAGGASFRIGCDDEGYPIPEAKKKKATPKPVTATDKWRAETKVPRHDYKGMNFEHMSSILNGWLNASSSHQTKSCELWDVEELQQLQALLYIAKEAQFDQVYKKTNDNRRIRNEIMKDLDFHWKELNYLASDHSDPMIKRMRRDGHCHEAVMWYVHHLTEDLKQLLKDMPINIPLLSPFQHDCTMHDDESTVAGKVCSAYRQQVTCADCHSNI